MYKVAVIGAGLSGLSVCYHLLNSSHFEVTLFDNQEIGKGTSGIAAGLLHPFAGLHAKLNPFGFEAYTSTLKLLQISEEALGEKVFIPSQVLRLALTEEQKRSYAMAAKKYSEIEWKSSEECQSLVQGIPFNPGILIPSGITVKAEKYLKGLFKACLKLGLHFELRKVASLNELEEFNFVVIAAGDKSSTFTPLPITAVKGQILELSYPKNCVSLSIPLNSQGYILMGEKGNSCVVGSSYERNFMREGPVLEEAKKEILPKVIPLFPSLAESEIISCKAGVRASTPDHLPICKQLDKKTFVLTGMGSKGFLYHSYYGEKIKVQLKEAALIS